MPGRRPRGSCQCLLCSSLYPKAQRGHASALRRASTGVAGSMEKRTKPRGAPLCLTPPPSLLLLSVNLEGGISFSCCPGGVLRLCSLEPPLSPSSDIQGAVTRASPLFATSVSSRIFDRREAQVWRLGMSPLQRSGLRKQSSTSTCVAHRLSVGYLPVCPSVEMAACRVPGPRASSIKPRCQSPASWLQETLPSRDPSLYLRWGRLRPPACL